MNDGAILFAQGNEACVRGALYAGLHFFAGYPITPSTEIAELLSTELPRLEGKFIQMEDEIASLCAVCAASIAGSKAMTATSGPGFSLMQEALGYAIMGEIPCVVTSVQRGGPSTGLPTKVAQGDVNQSRWGVHGDHAIIVLTASSVQDVFSVTVEGFNMAETYRTPVILLFDEVVGHMRERLEMPEPGELPVVERLRTSVKAGVNYYPYLPREDGRLPMSALRRVTPLQCDRIRIMISGDSPRSSRELSISSSTISWTKSSPGPPRSPAGRSIFSTIAQQVFVSYGSSARSALHLVHTLRGKGIRAGLLELQTLWPFPSELVRERTEKARTVYVVEMNMGHMAAQVRQNVKSPDRVFLVNRVDGQLITPTDISRVMRVIEGRGF